LTFLEENPAVVLRMRLCAGRFQVRIPVMAIVCSPLQTSRLALRPTQPPGSFVLAFFPGDKAAGGGSLTNHLYQVPRWWWSVKSFR